MAEDEIRKHTKAAYQALKNPDTDWKHKLKEVLTEVLIIVFAITLSLWFHNWSDSRQEHKEEADFLTGFKTDLKIDIDNLVSSQNFYENELHGIRYFMKVGAGDTLSKDSLGKYVSIFFSTTIMEPRISRYEGLKGSGRFGIIENKELLNNIINLQEESIVHIETLNTYYHQYIERMATFIEEHAQLSQPGEITNGIEIIRNPQMRFLLGYGKSTITNNIIPAHSDAIQNCNEIIKEIDKELKK